MFIFVPLGNVMSPGCCPGLHGPTYLPSMIVVDSFMQPIGGSKVACASVWYAVLPVNVITDFDCIFVPPRSQTMSLVILPPAFLRSYLLHMFDIMPIDILYISFCTESSRQSVDAAGALPAPRAVDVVVSHSPGFSFGNSSAASAAVAATVKQTAMAMVRMSSPGSVRSPSYRRTRARASPRASWRRAQRRGSAAAASPGSAARGWCGTSR